MHKLAFPLVLTLITVKPIQVKAEQDKISSKPPAANEDKPNQKTKAKIRTLDELIQKLLKKGYISRTTISGTQARSLGFIEDKPARFFVVPPDRSVDGWKHVALVPLEIIEEKEKPLAIIFSKTKEDREDLALNVRYFKLSMNGKLELAWSVTGKLHEDMTPVTGSGTEDFPDIDSPSVQEGLQREMDFWLKGMYRKPAAGETAASEESAKPASPSKTDQSKP